MDFMEEHPGFAAALASEANYKHGHIRRPDSKPALFLTTNRIDLGLAACRDAILDDINNGNGAQAPVYRGSDDVGPDSRFRSTLIANSRHEALRAAYNSLDICMRDQIMPRIACNDFIFSQRYSSNPFTVHRRQQLVYQTNDHFQNTGNGIKGHADDSIWQGKWVRNDPQRHIVGLLYLTDHVDRAVDDDPYRFSGGDLIFPMIADHTNVPFVVHPYFGMLCFFPASPLYIHMVSKITSGTRIVVTTWYSLDGYE